MQITVFKKFIACLICVTLSSCATYKTRSFPEYSVEDFNQSITMKAVTVSIKLLTPAQSESVLGGIDVEKKHIQPVLIKIDNNSNKTYIFDRENINVSTLSQEKALKLLSFDAGKRARTYGAIGGFCLATIILWPIAVVMFLASGIDYGATKGENQEIKNDFREKILDRCEIMPNSTKIGLVFSGLYARTDLTEISLVDAETDELLKFPCSIKEY